ncbi:MAG: CPBP family intramembrane metalloprotease [Bryobacterales bacterium]|nr:CPBP family intramembrane metalloprotease [Bryobacterales bacterium]
MKVPIAIPVSLRVTLAAVWTAAAAAAWLLLPKDISLPVRLPFLFAACVEIACYLAPGWEALRESLGKRFPAWQLAGGLWLSAVVPYAIYAVGTGTGSLAGTLALVGLTGAASGWYALFRRRSGAAGALMDLGFLALMGAVMLGGVFGWIYPDAAERLQAEFLGRVMWIRLGVLAALLLRRMEGTGFGFWPSAREWRVGVLGFLLLMPVLLGMGWALDFFTIREWTRPAWQMGLIAGGSFLGFLWVVALSEEFFLRGLLQQWATAWTGSGWWGLALTVLVSGAVHLPFGGRFPNWKFAALAAVAHLGYGIVFQRGRGVRAAMVTHALVVTVWRAFLR